MKNIPKQYLIVGGVLLIIVAAAAYFMITPKNNSAEVENKDTVFEDPSEVIPTVDSSVKVDIEGNTEAVISLSGLPEGTEEIEYELSYNTANGSIEGVFGTIEVKSGADSAEEDILFGTSSSGVNRYHEIDGPVKGTFKFSGSYGQRMLEKEFEL